jgi:hypothetical protein
MRDQYASLPSVLGQLQQRTSLRANVERWWQSQGWPIPDFLPPVDQPSAFLLRQVATARFEDIAFSLMARAAGLQPIWGEYTSDTYAIASHFKRSLVHRTVTDGRNKHGHARTQTHQLFADANKLQGQRLADIRLGDGSSLVDFHHELQSQLVPGRVERFDASDILASAGLHHARDYYAFTFSWFIAHGVLFEDFHTSDGRDAKEDRFVANVVEPAWEVVRRQFNAVPLIVALPWWKELAFYPKTSAWQDHKMIPPTFLTSIGFVG